MFERILILTKMQYINESRGIHTHISIGRSASKIIVSIIVITLLFFGLFYVMNKTWSFPINQNMFIFFLIILQLISILVSTISLSQDLFKNKNNQILLSLAAKNDEIFASKILLYYFNELIRTLTITLPLMVSIGIIVKAGVFYFLNAIVLLIVLPLIAVLIASLLSMLFVFVSTFLRKLPYVSFILGLLLIGLLFYFIYISVNTIPYPIRIIQLYSAFVTNITNFTQKISSYGFIYRYAGQLMFGSNVLLNWTYIIGFFLVLFIVVSFVSKPFFFKLTNYSSDISTKITKKPKSNSNEKSVYTSILKKEMLLMVRNPVELITNYATLFGIPFFLYVINYVYFGMSRSTPGNKLMTFFNLFICLLLSLSANSASAVSITKEGSEFTIMKTAPSNTKVMAYSKITFNLIISFIMISVGFLIVFLTVKNFPQFELLMIYVLTILINFGHILWCFQRDIVNPTLSDYAQRGSLDGNKNLGAAVNSGVVLSILFSVITLGLILFVDINLCFLIMGSISLIFVLFRFIYFRFILNSYFYLIEY